MNPRSLAVAAALLLLAVPCSVSAQSPRLVRDIRPGSVPGQSVPFTGVAHDGHLFFNASHPEFGIEPWISDGTAAGTHLLIDLAPGRQSSDPRSFTACGTHRVVFTVAVPESDPELWVTDGTTMGTYRLLRASTSAHTPFLDGAVFTAYTAANGSEPWFTDGTIAGTRLLRDVEPGTASSSPQEYTVIDGQVFFSAQTATSGREPWKVSGSLAVSQIADIEPGTGSSSPRSFAAQGGGALFAARTAATGTELWRTNGTSGTTAAVADLAPGTASSTPAGFTPLGDHLYFSATDGQHGRELWRTDGTASGTTLVRDIVPGTTSSNPAGLVAYGGRLVFAASTPDTGVEPWATDGTAGGTGLLRDLRQGTSGSAATGFAVVGTGVVFRADDGASGNEIFYTDGTPGHTWRLGEVNPAGSGVAHLLDVLGGQLFFEGNDGTGWELWATNGTLPGPWLVANIVGDVPNGSVPRGLVALNDLALFVASTDDGGRELWRTDATTGGTWLVLDILPGSDGSNPSGLTAVGDRVFFVADDGVHGPELWVTDGSTAGTRLVRDIRPGVGGGDLRSLTPWRGSLLFSADDGVHGPELWISDGTSAGTTMVMDLSPGSAGSQPGAFVTTDVAAYFAAAGQVWRTVGSAATTTTISNTGDAYPLAAIGTQILLMDRQHPTYGHELWVYDRGQTNLLRDLRPGGEGSNPHDAVVVGDVAYFVADDGAHGAELWRTDGTAAGTRLVADLEPGSGHAYPEHLTAAANVLYFTAHTGFGRELYSCVGGIARRLTDLGTALWPGVDGASLSVIGLGDAVAFAGADARGYEMWAVGGGSVRFVAEVMPGNGGGHPNAIARIGTQLVFAAEGPAGAELYAIAATAARAAATVSYGAGCSRIGEPVGVATQWGAPRAGSDDFELRLTDARPRSACLLLASVGRADLPVGGGCRLLVSPPFLDFPSVTDSAGIARFPLPLAPGLEGLSFACQWFVSDPGGAAFGAGWMSRGLEVMVGL